MVQNLNAAMVLAEMMRRAGDEYCVESAVLVRDESGQVIIGWRGGTNGWQQLGLDSPPQAGGESAGPHRASARFSVGRTEPLISSEHTFV
jgi:hypothetical protein